MRPLHIIGYIITYTTHYDYKRWFERMITSLLANMSRNLVCDSQIAGLPTAQLLFYQRRPTIGTYTRLQPMMSF